MAVNVLDELILDRPMMLDPTKGERFECVVYLHGVTYLQFSEDVVPHPCEIHRFIH
jgi:hypothetical protein